MTRFTVSLDQDGTSDTTVPDNIQPCLVPNLRSTEKAREFT
jgi:hypothetical protein